MLWLSTVAKRVANLTYILKNVYCAHGKFVSNYVGRIFLLRFLRLWMWNHINNIATTAIRLLKIVSPYNTSLPPIQLAFNDYILFGKVPKFNWKSASTVVTTFFIGPYHKLVSAALHLSIANGNVDEKTIAFHSQNSRFHPTMPNEQFSRARKKTASDEHTWMVTLSSNAIQHIIKALSIPLWSNKN